MDKRLINFIAITITIIWAISFMADIILTTYAPSPYIHPLMMIVAGAAFAKNVTRKD